MKRKSSLKNKKSIKPKVKAENAFKNWINQDVVFLYSDLVDDSRVFRKQVGAVLNELELRQRVRLISDHLKARVGDQQYLGFMKETLSWVEAKDLRGFQLWPLLDFIERYGLQYFSESLDYMYLLTERFSAEFAIRSYLTRDPKLTYSYLEKVSKSTNEHHRRWASEGSRPRLPWGMKLHGAVRDPRAGFRILENLKFDNSVYVQKSVANHLNDVAKDHPDLVVNLLKRWLKEGRVDQRKNLDFIVSRSLRTLIKSGYPPALSLIGVQAGTKDILFSQLKISAKTVALNQPFSLEVSLQNNSQSDLKYVLDYEIYFKKANGKNMGKVFKWSSGVLKKGEKKKLLKKHNIKPITTRVYYPGDHWVCIKLNGQLVKKMNFDLII